MITLAKKFPAICFEKFKSVELSSQIYKIKELDYLLRNQQSFCPKFKVLTQQKQKNFQRFALKNSKVLSYLSNLRQNQRT